MKKQNRLLTSLVMALLLASPLACGDQRSVTAPEPSTEVQASLLGGVLGGVTDVVGGVTETVDGTTDLLVGVVRTLLSPIVCDVDESDYASRYIGPAGGTIRVAGHTLTVPSGALSEYTRITAYAPEGRYAEVRFSPHGLKFEKPVTLTISYEDCGRVGTSGRVPAIVYTDDARNILEVLASKQDWWRKTVTAQTDHFSGYLLAE